MTRSLWLWSVAAAAPAARNGLFIFNLKFILISSVLYKPPFMLNMLLVAAAVLLVSMPKNSVFVKVVKHSEGFYPHLDFNSSFLPL